MKRLKDKVAVITGGSKGIGKSIALALAQEGCHIAITARTESELKKTAGVISRYGVKSFAARMDVRKPREVIAFAKKVRDNLGPVQILINNAGIGRFAEVVTFKDEDFVATIETNLLGAFYCTKAFLPPMIQRREGHIINIASLAGKNTFAAGSAYCASKHGLIALSECLMMEVRQYNIKVTSICPGTVQTGFGHQTGRDKSWALTSEDVSKAVVDVLTSSAGSLISMVELRPLKPPMGSRR